jgi:hypothetical protein
LQHYKFALKRLELCLWAPLDSSWCGLNIILHRNIVPKDKPLYCNKRCHICHQFPPLFWTNSWAVSWDILDSCTASCRLLGNFCLHLENDAPNPNCPMTDSVDSYHRQSKCFLEETESIYYKEAKPRVLHIQWCQTTPKTKLKPVFIQSPSSLPLSHDTTSRKIPLPCIYLFLSARLYQ